MDIQGKECLSCVFWGEEKRQMDFGVTAICDGVHGPRFNRRTREDFCCSEWRSKRDGRD